MGENIANSIKTNKTDHLKYLSTINNPNYLFLEPITKVEIKNYILKTKDKTSFNRNGLSNFILKQISDYILIPLEHNIFNLALVKGSFPNIFKQTLIVLIFKSGDKNVCSNYHPISLTFTLSKILENVLKLG